MQISLTKFAGCLLLIELLMMEGITGLTEACTLLPFDSYGDLSCKVDGWYNDTKLPCNTYKAANTDDHSFLYLPVGKTVTIYCPLRHVLVGATTYKCTETGFDPPIKLDNTTSFIDPHPVCIDVEKWEDNVCDTDTLPDTHPHYMVYSDADYVLANQPYRVVCESGYSTNIKDSDLIYGVCLKTLGKWQINGSKCLGMCSSEVRYTGGTEKNTLVSYSNYKDLQVTTNLGMSLQAVGTVVNVSISCEDGHSPTGSRNGEFQLTCSVNSDTDIEGFYRQTRKQTVVNCQRDCMVPDIPEGKLLDPYTGMVLSPGTRTMRNGQDSARIRCPLGTYAIGRVNIECYDGNITHEMPTCTREVQPCEAPNVNNGVKAPHSRIPGDEYTLECEPGYALKVTTNPKVKCKELSGRRTDFGIPASELTPASSFWCHVGCSLPMSSISNGDISPKPSLTGAPYKRGQTISISCFNGTETQHSCIFDGWDSENWADCTPVSGSTAFCFFVINFVFMSVFLCLL